MTRTKRHLLVGDRTACGLVISQHQFTQRNEAGAITTRPEEVTCLGCRRTVAMADAEVGLRGRRRR